MLSIDDGDVLKVHGSARTPSFPLCQHSNRVQICLDSCIESIHVPFQEDKCAVEILSDQKLQATLSLTDDWRFAPLPIGVHLHPATFEDSHCQTELHHSKILALELYVDGATTSDSSAWAVVAVYKTDVGHLLCGCLAGVTTLNPGELTWIGAEQHTNIDAELTAMSVAAAFAHFACADVPVILRPDLALSRQFLQLRNTSRQSSALAQLLHVLGHTLPSIALRCKKYVRTQATHGTSLQTP